MMKVKAQLMAVIYTLQSILDELNSWIDLSDFDDDCIEHDPEPEPIDFEK